MFAVGIKQWDQIFTVSMNFRRLRPTFSAGEFARGYLDDLLIMSFGNYDMSSHFIEVGVNEVLEDHLLCDSMV
jgi:hypothetical protein